jgi:hypothetical protein
VQGISILGGLSMADDKNQGKQDPQTPDQEQEQKRRAPGSEQEHQGGQSDKRQDKRDDEQEPERKRA